MRSLTAKYLRVTYPNLFEGLFTIIPLPEEKAIDCIYIDGRHRLFRLTAQIDIFKRFEGLERMETQS